MSIVDELRSVGHLTVDDGYYSCPMADNYMGDETECDCLVPLLREAANHIRRLERPPLFKLGR